MVEAHNRIMVEPLSQGGPKKGLALINGTLVSTAQVFAS